MRLAIIGGTGVYGLASAAVGDPKPVETTYGPTVVSPAELSGHEVFFLARHGPDHAIPPHRINYRANIAAIRDLGCTAVIATNAVGSLRRDIPPASFIVPDQFIDFTKVRPLSFFDGDSEHGVKHVDMTEPYCPNVRGWLLAAAAEVGERCADGGTYLCAEGPRFETPAEIRMFAAWGADVVGMTGVPEVVLAREAGLCYASLCLVTNFAAGISTTPLSHQEVTELMDGRIEDVNELLAAAVTRAVDTPDCLCRRPIV
jgi:5'-methylthioadenosine phosphorylase